MQASFAGLAHGILDLLRAAAPCLGVAVSRWGAFARLAGERCISRARNCPKTPRVSRRKCRNFTGLRANLGGFDTPPGSFWGRSFGVVRYVMFRRFTIMPLNAF